MADRNAVRTELEKATGLEQKDGENDARYRQRLVRAVLDLPEPTWEKLSTEAQEWVNEGVDAIKAKKKVDDFPEGESEEDDGEEESEEEESEDDDGEEEPEEEEEEDGEEEEEEDPDGDDGEDGGEEESEEDPDPAPRSGKKPGKEKKAVKKDSKKSGRARGGVQMLHRLVVKNPTWDREQVTEALEKAGFPMAVNTIGAGFYTVRSIMRLAVEEGVDPKDHVEAVAGAKKSRKGKKQDAPAKKAPKAKGKKKGKVKKSAPKPKRRKR